LASRAVCEPGPCLPDDALWPPSTGEGAREVTGLPDADTGAVTTLRPGKIDMPRMPASTGLVWANWG
jgi:hypothetical protein